MAKENTEYNMAEDLLRDLEGLVSSLECYEKIANNSPRLSATATLFGFRKLLRRAKRARAAIATAIRQRSSGTMTCKNLGGSSRR